jgi:hypothetical protein
LIKSLEDHKKVLVSRQKRISVLLNTIEKTVVKLKTKKMIKDEELYEGFSKEETTKIRLEAIEKYGKERVETSENYLKKLTKEQIEQLKAEQKEIFNRLYELSTKDPESEVVQMEIARHYKNTRKFWGTDGTADSQWRNYKGLGELFTSDARFTIVDGKEQPEFALFLSKAIAHFAITQLK